MMDHVVGYIVRRGMEAHASFRAGTGAGDEPKHEVDLVEVLSWAMVIVGGIAFICVMLTTMVS